MPAKNSHGGFKPRDTISNSAQIPLKRAPPETRSTDSNSGQKKNKRDENTIESYAVLNVDGQNGASGDLIDSGSPIYSTRLDLSPRRTRESGSGRILPKSFIRPSPVASLGSGVNSFFQNHELHTMTTNLKPERRDRRNSLKSSDDNAAMFHNSKKATSTGNSGGVTNKIIHFVDIEDSEVELTDNVLDTKDHAGAGDDFSGHKVDTVLRSLDNIADSDHDRGLEKKSRRHVQSHKIDPDRKVLGLVDNGQSNTFCRPLRWTGQPRNELLRNKFKRDLDVVHSDDTDELQQVQPMASSSPRHALGEIRSARQAESRGSQAATQLKNNPSANDIPSTRFTSSRKGSQRQVHVRKSASTKGSISELGRLLRAFYSEDFSSEEQKELYLTRDQNNRTYIIFQSDRKQFEFSPKQIIKIVIAESHLAVRLFGRSDKGLCASKIHIVFNRSEDGQAFSNELMDMEQPDVDIHQKPDIELQKMLERWQGEQAEEAGKPRRRSDHVDIYNQPLPWETVSKRHEPLYASEVDAPAAKKAKLADGMTSTSYGTRSDSFFHSRSSGSHPDRSRARLMPVPSTPSDGMNLRNTRSKPKANDPASDSLLNNARSSATVEPATKYSQTHGLGDPWDKPLVFPQTGPNKTTVEWQDMFRLDDEEFLNDNLISFWLRYSQKCHEEISKQVYFFNTFFYSTLTKPVKGRRGINYDLVKRWTAKIDLFKYDYVVVPINEDLHWYAAIICNLRNINRNVDQDDDEEEEKREEAGEEAAKPLGRNQGPSKITSKTESITNTSIAKGDHIEALVQDDKNLALKYSQLSISPMEIDAEETLNVNTSEAEMLPTDYTHSSLMPVETPVDRTEEASENQKESALLEPTPKKKGKQKSMPLRKLDPDEPVIITLDSFDRGHSPVVKNLKEYLREEGKAKRGIDIEIHQNGVTAKGIPLQKNFCDCGLYLIFYIAKFLQNPRAFISQILLRELDAKNDWPNISSSDIRNAIRKTIIQEHRKQLSVSTEFKDAPKKPVMNILVGEAAKKDKQSSESLIPSQMTPYSPVQQTPDSVVEVETFTPKKERASPKAMAATKATIDNLDDCVIYEGAIDKSYKQSQRHVEPSWSNQLRDAASMKEQTPQLSEEAPAKTILLPRFEKWSYATSTGPPDPHCDGRPPTRGKSS